MHVNNKGEEQKNKKSCLHQCNIFFVLLPTLCKCFSGPFTQVQYKRIYFWWVGCWLAGL